MTARIILSTALLLLASARQGAAAADPAAGVTATGAASPGVTSPGVTVSGVTVPAPWLDSRLTPDRRATLAVAAMTLDEKIGLVHGPVALPHGAAPFVPLPGALVSAGFVPGIPRLGLPALYETDASLGIGNPGGIRPGDVATALPSSLALAASFDPELAHRAGTMLGVEARAKGFNVLLGGGMDLTRDPRNGRNFEYLGEDPLLAGVLAGEQVRGTQDEHVISTVKHFALNANETNRTDLDARMDRAALRESDLLAFEIAIERGRPGSVMCAYNLVNGEHACANHWLLQDVLKTDWRYPGWVMSDWGAVHSELDAAAGLDQESGEQIDKAVYFAAPLKAAVASGRVPTARLDDMVHRILRSMFAVGIADRREPHETIDYAQHARLALEIAHRGMVLLKNADALLPLPAGAASIAVIGGNAKVGVLSGGGSAQVIPANEHFGGMQDCSIFGLNGELYDPSSPLAAIKQAAPKADVRYDPGVFPGRAAALAAKTEIAIVFVTRHEREGFDIPDLVLPEGQDALVEAVAAANPHTIVVLETGNPVAMPWAQRVPAVLAAWYPGQEGGQAIADVLFGRVNPSGRLPITWPVTASQFLRPTLPNLAAEPGVAVSIDYAEGAAAGYRWYAQANVTPRYPFGYGLSYTSFEYGDLQVTGGATLTVQFSIRNTGTVRGADVGQVYLTSAAGRRTLRLIGFQRVELDPGERRTVTVAADRRVLGWFDEAHRQWRLDAGVYRVQLGKSASDLSLGGDAVLATSRGF